MDAVEKGVVADSILPRDDATSDENWVHFFHLSKPRRTKFKDRVIISRETKMIDFHRTFSNNIIRTRTWETRRAETTDTRPRAVI